MIVIFVIKEFIAHYEKDALGFTWIILNKYIKWYDVSQQAFTII